MIILAGFGPYSNYNKNISGEIVKNIKEPIFNIKVIKKILPVSWKLSIESYKHLLNSKALNPKVAVLLGIHNSKYYHLEVYSWNIAFGKDITNKFKMRPIKFNSKLILKTILNISKLCVSLKTRTKIKISYFPGYYLCNYIYYWALLLSERKYPVVFIHIPYSIELHDGLKTIEKLIITILTTHPIMK